MHAAGVFRHIATDGASDLAGRIGRVIKPQGRSGFADGQVAHTALHHGGSAVQIHFQNFVEFGQGQRDALGVRHGTTRQTGACATGHHRHTQLVAGAQHGLNLFVGFGQHHAQGALTVGGQAIALVGRGVFGRGQHRMGGQNGAQGRQHQGVRDIQRLALGREGGVHGLYKGENHYCTTKRSSGGGRHKLGQ